MGQYLRSLELLLERDDRMFLPTHGTAIPDPKPFVRSFIEHRREREAQILDCLGRGSLQIKDMVPIMYAQTPVFLHGAAARSVLAHMLHLLELGTVTCEGEPGLAARYHLK
jgi:glyoxylase-like metal-dependent hydrolase (beta-lactamase superfamily II)